MIRAWTANGPRQKLEPFEYDPGDRRRGGRGCRRELWHPPFRSLDHQQRLGYLHLSCRHEVISRVANMGPQAKGRRSDKPWAAAGVLRAACIVINACRAIRTFALGMSRPSSGTTRLRRAPARSMAIGGPATDGLDVANAGPLLCGGTTVFATLWVFDIKPTAPEWSPIAPSATAASIRIPVISPHMTANPYFWS